MTECRTVHITIWQYSENKTLVWKIDLPNPSVGVHFRVYNFSINGIKKAKVFPEPVLAAPIKEKSLDEWT